MGYGSAAFATGWLTYLCADKLRFRLRTIPSGEKTSDKRGYCFFPDAEAATDAVAVTFLYSALA